MPKSNHFIGSNKSKITLQPYLHLKEHYSLLRITFFFIPKCSDFAPIKSLLLGILHYVEIL